MAHPCALARAPSRGHREPPGGAGSAAVAWIERGVRRVASGLERFGAMSVKADILEN